MAQLRDEELLNRIVARIKKLRKQRGVTLEEFYMETDINLSRIESSRSNISISTLSSICNYFGVTLSEFFKGI